MGDGVKFKAKLHNPKTATREQLAEQITEITRYLVLVAEDFEQRIIMLHDHATTVEELCNISAEQRKRWASGHTKEFDSLTKSLNVAYSRLKYLLAEIVHGLEIVIKEDEFSIRLLKVSESSLEAIREFEIEDYSLEKRDYSGLLGRAKQNLGPAIADTTEALEEYAKLMAIQEKIIGLLEHLHPLLERLSYYVKQESNTVEMFSNKQQGFDPNKRQSAENYLKTLVLQVEETLLQEKKFFYDPFNQLARSEVTPVDNLAKLISSSRRDHLVITKDDVKRIERTLTEPDELLMLGSMFLTHKDDDIIEPAAYKYAMKLFQNARKGMKEVKLKATHDMMMGIKNRASFESDIHSAIKDKRPFALIIIDIDHFKQFNDKFGHDIGDKVLVEVAGILKKSLKKQTDEVYRIGGEEIAIILLDTEKQGGFKVAEKLRKAVQEHRLTDHEGNQILQPLTISAGVVGVHDFQAIDLLGLNKEEAAKKAIKQADTLLYKAKESGRNNVKDAYFDPNFEVKK
ncbi:GGDEF domain-containing protein [Candidatus Woesearchaeota archaeon]|nr:GGDEF domain-containing protein [Candidatus Woesearchaeota archaeon]